MGRKNYTPRIQLCDCVSKVTVSSKTTSSDMVKAIDSWSKRLSHAKLIVDGKEV